MINWLLTLPAVWMIVVVLAGTYVVSAIILFTVVWLARGERKTTMSSLSLRDCCRLWAWCSD